jgi:hypothetical protein
MPSSGVITPSIRPIRQHGATRIERQRRTTAIHPVRQPLDRRLQLYARSRMYCKPAPQPGHRNRWPRQCASPRSSRSRLLIKGSWTTSSNGQRSRHCWSFDYLPVLLPRGVAALMRSSTARTTIAAESMIARLGVRLMPMIAAEFLANSS